MHNTYKTERRGQGWWSDQGSILWISFGMHFTENLYSGKTCIPGNFGTFIFSVDTEAKPFTASDNSLSGNYGRKMYSYNPPLESIL
jgi:hypothetical protein